MLTTLRQDLEAWGPDAQEQRPLSLEAARQYTRRVALGHYENFPVVTWLLPRPLRQPFYDIYAFCRWSDDLGDELSSPEESLRLLNWWRCQLQQCLAGESRHPVYIALQETFRTHSLDQQHFHDLITAFERDQTQRRYETYADLQDYCRCSANPVGRVLLELTEADLTQTVELADAVCTGLQLINFWQDVARDGKIGRIYLPAEDCRRFGVSESEILASRPSAAFRQLMEFQVERAARLLARGEELSRRVPPAIRFDIRLFALGGLKVCQKISRNHYDVLSTRPKLSKADLPELFYRAVSGRFPRVN